MILCGHIVNAVGADDVVGVLQRVTQCLTELWSAWLGSLRCDRNGGIEQQVAIIAIAAERIAAALAECLLVPLYEIQGDWLDRVAFWQVLGNDKRATGRDSALNRLASGLDEFRGSPFHGCDRFVCCSRARPGRYGAARCLRLTHQPR
jgi:hypothetical protein